MSETDPREELEEIVDLYNKGHMPEMAYEWAISASDTTQSIIETMEDMEMNGIDVPTGPQEEALSNIYKAACNWLKK